MPANSLGSPGRGAGSPGDDAGAPPPPKAVEDGAKDNKSFTVEDEVDTSRRVRFTTGDEAADTSRPTQHALPDKPSWSALDMMHAMELGPQANMQDLRKTPPSSRGSLFTNFEDVQLTDEERLFINAAAMGDVPIIRQSLEENEIVLNFNCVDYMGRNALHLAVDSESMECIELLLDKLSFENTEEALLHAISKGATKIVKVIIEHPNYMAGEDQLKRTGGGKDPFFRTEEKSQFSPDITPLILAGHYNNHEIIQMFLARSHTIEKPHPISCTCNDCVTKQNYDSLKRSRSRLNAYKALASPAYIALSSSDPIMATFELRQEMKKLAQVEKEFKNEYLSLVEQCMDFACEMMDLCRGTQEVEAVLSEGGEENGTRDPLARLKMAIEYEEKKFVAHPNCQQHLTNIWYGPEMGFMQSLTWSKKIIMWPLCIPLVPIFCIVYIFSPDSKIGNAMRCPATKFITHTFSHITFLILLAAATFRIEDKGYHVTSVNVLRDDPYDPETHQDKVESLLKGTLRPANSLITNVQICLMFWVLGLLWMECKQMYNSGLRVYLLDNYNWMDFTLLSFYLASYLLRFLVDHWIKTADRYFDGTNIARLALIDRNYTMFEMFINEIETHNSPHSYFMRASRFEWKPDDPEIVSDVLFAVANVMSIARTTYLMPAFEVLGPLQISLGRMLGDITRFLVLFTLVLFAFMVGLHNLYWYYGSQTFTLKNSNSTGPESDKVIHSTEAFQGLPRTLYSLFWSMFGLVSVDSVEIKYPNKEKNQIESYSFPGGNHATSIVEGVGMFLFALYHVAIIIVLVNMLIAMMSHSFEDIQGDCDVEWKFARTRLWMNYIDEGSTLPVPFNMIPTPKSCRYAWRWLKDLFRKEGDGLLDFERGKRQTFIKGDTKERPRPLNVSKARKRRENVCQNLNIETPETSYVDILQRLVRRYLFKLERQKLENDGKEGVQLGADSIFANTTEVKTTTVSTEPAFADSEDPDDQHRHLAPPPPPQEDTGSSLQGGLRRRMSMRGGSRQNRSRRPSVSHHQPPAGTQVQLLSIPQLDAIARTLRLLDVRLQHIQAAAKDEERMKDDVEHIRRVMSENQKALSTVVTCLSSIQEEIRRENVCKSLNIEAPETSYVDILQRLVRRYLFKLEREKLEQDGKDSVNMGDGGVFEVKTMNVNTEPEFADEDEENDTTRRDSSGGGKRGLRRRMSMRGGGGKGRGARPPRPPSVGGEGGTQIQLLQIPQLDAISRTLRLVDVRLQHIQAAAKDEERMKDDIDHVRRVMSQNQTLLHTVVTVLAAIQEETRNQSILLETKQNTTFSIAPPVTKRSLDRTTLDMENSEV